jgi:hypothetical protein
MKRPARSRSVTTRLMPILRALTHAYGKQHLTLCQRHYGVWQVRFQHQNLAVTEPMMAGRGLDGKLAAETVDHDMTRCPMLRQTAARLEREQ